MENRNPLKQPLVDQGGMATPPTAPTSVKDRKLERSCLMCHQRKIRCDKRSPCANCVRVDLFCCYPGLERSRRRPHKTTISDVATRVAQLERTITAISNGVAQLNSVSTPIPGPVPLDGNVGDQQIKEDSSKDELLMQDGYSSRYVNEALLSRILEEEQELQSIMESPSADGNRGGNSLSFDIGTIFSGFNQRMADSQSYYPSRWQATQLWQAFVNNVDPIAKVLHIPTAQATFFAAINQPNEVDDDLNALLFSIYFSATTSLTSIDAAHMLGQDKSSALRKYKQGLEQSLTCANILETPSIRSLQAMAIYLRSLRVYSGGRSVWTLNGLAIRSAQSIGLHRDGKNFNLSPFESEMRRRLWWCMFQSDCRAGEDHGIALSSFDSSSDTRFPMNINDNEISPDMQELPVAKPKWTEMTFTLLMMEISYVSQRLLRTQVVPIQAAPSEISTIRTLTDLMTRLDETYLKHCDRNIPIQQAAVLVARAVIAKMQFVARQQELRPDLVARHAINATEENLITACEIIEMGLKLQSDDLLRGFQWFFETYTPYHLLTYVLWHLCVKPFGLSVDRAWDSVDKCFEIGDRCNLSSELGSKWILLQRLRSKATHIRVAHNADQSMADNTQNNLSEMVTVTEEIANIPEFIITDGTNWDTWDMRPADFPDWTNFADKFDQHDFAI